MTPPMSPQLTPEERSVRLHAAGYNVMNLDAADVELDLFTDVPPRSFDEAIARSGIEAATVGAREPDLAKAAEAVYGPARFVFTTKGRAAETALAAAFGRTGYVALAHPLFKTTQHSIVVHGAKVEPLPLAGGGTADVDVPALEARLASGDVSLVYAEPGTNALGAAPLSLESFTAVSAACRARGVTLWLDAARLLANCARLPGDLLETARRFTALADAFTVSCAKELRVPYGAIIGVRDPGMQRRAFAHAFQEGTLLEPLEQRVRLARALERTAADPAPIRERARQLTGLADALRRSGVAVHQPIGGHAVYVAVDRALVERPLANRALEGVLYCHAGVRTLINPYPSLGGPHARLALAVGRYSDEQLARVAEALPWTFAHAASAPRLVDTGEGLHDVHARYRVDA